jgi:hypothetical protein
MHLVKLRTIARRNIWVAVVCAFALALPTVAYAVSVNYVTNATFYYGDQGSTSGWAPRAWNKVYRPVNGCNPGSKFGLFYSDTGNVYNWCSNPFTDTRSDSNYVQSFCHDWDDINSSYPVTCVTTKP